MARMKYGYLLLVPEDMGDSDVRATVADVIVANLSAITGLEVTIDQVTLRRSEALPDWVPVEERWPEGAWGWRASVVVDDGVVVAP